MAPPLARARAGTTAAARSTTAEADRPRPRPPATKTRPAAGCCATRPDGSVGADVATSEPVPQGRRSSVQVAPRPDASFKDTFDALARQIEQVLRGKKRAVHLVARLPVRRRSPADRGRARRRQDLARQGDRPLDRRLVAAHPVHPRPPALRRDRAHRSGTAARSDFEFRAGRRVRERRARRRDQPRVAEDAVRAARGDGGAPGHGRHGDVQAARAVHGDRDAEPGRARGDVSAARGPARPLPAAVADRLPGSRRRARDPRRVRRRRARRRRAAAGVRRRDDRGVVQGAHLDPHRARAAGLRRRPRRRDPPSPRPDARREPTRRARVAACVARALAASVGRAVRRSRRHQVARAVDARAPAGLVARGDDARRERGRRAGLGARQRSRSRPTARSEPRC